MAAPGVVSRAGKRVAGEYIVIFDSATTPDATSMASEFVKRHGVKQRFVYDSAFRGFSFVGTEAQALAMSNDPRVRSVSENSVVTLDASVYQTPAPSWGLDRLNQQFSLIYGDNLYSAGYTGVGAVIYFIDSGINPIASEFGGRVRASHNWAVNQNGLIDPNDASDCYGHGTLVASVAAGAVYGVAKDASIVNLRVTDCNGAFANSAVVIAGINWMINDHLTNHPTERAVANMSLGTFNDRDTPLDAAAINAVQSGISVVVSAGNQALDACTRSPAAVGNPTSYPAGNGASVVTVGALSYGSTETFAGYSNFGNCVDILGAGGATGMTKYGVPGADSGTSYASPLVAGVIALHMERYGVANSPSMYEGLIKDNGNQNQVSNVPADTPNLLIYSGINGHGHICCS